MPSAGRPKTAVQPNQDGSVTIQYVPTQSGVHELNVSYNDAPVEGWFLLSYFLIFTSMRPLSQKIGAGKPMPMDTTSQGWILKVATKDTGVVACHF